VDALVVIRKGRFKLTIPHPLTADVQFVVTQTADINSGRIHRPIQTDGLAKDRIAARLIGIILRPWAGQPDGVVESHSRSFRLPSIASSTATESLPAFPAGGASVISE